MKRLDLLDEKLKRNFTHITDRRRQFIGECDLLSDLKNSQNSFVFQTHFFIVFGNFYSFWNVSVCLCCVRKRGQLSVWSYWLPGWCMTEFQNSPTKPKQNSLIEKKRRLTRCTRQNGIVVSATLTSTPATYHQPRYPQNPRIWYTHTLIERWDSSHRTRIINLINGKIYQPNSLISWRHKFSFNFSVNVNAEQWSDRGMKFSRL